MDVTFGSVRSRAVAVAIAAWKSADVASADVAFADVASAPGWVRVKSATRLLLPPPNWDARRASTWDDSESGSSQPPELSLPEARLANGRATRATARATRATIRRCR